MHETLGVEVIQLMGVGETDKWVQSRVAIPIDNDELEKQGGIVVLISKKEPDSVFLEEIVNKFQARVEKNQLDWLKQSKAEWKEKISEDESLVVMVVLKNEKNERVVYVTGLGVGANVNLERNGGQSKLWPVEGEVVCGQIKAGDIIILETKDLVSDTWKDQASPFEEKVEIVRAKVALSGDGDEAAAIIRVNEVLKERVVEEVFKERGEIILKPKEDKKKKIAVFLGLIFLVLFTVSVGVGMWRRAVILEENEYISTVQPIKDALSEAEKIKGVNIVRARDLIIEAKTAMAAEKKYETGKKATEWFDLKTQVDKAWVDLSGEKQSELKMWLNLAVIKEGMKAEKISVYRNWLSVLDKNGKILVVVDLKDKTSKMVMGGEDLSGVTLMDKNLVLTSKGIWQFVGETTAVFKPKLVVSMNEELTGILKIKQYASNIYSLDATEVWKFPLAETGIGARRRYFGVGVTPSMAEVVDFEVDGDVFLITSKGKVNRFSKGQKVAFELRGLSEEFGETVKVLSNIKTDELLVWDKQKGEVVIFNRESGEYKRKLMNEQFKQVADMIVDEENGRLMLAKDGEILEVALE